jgi:hypothetical protein
MVKLDYESLRNPIEAVASKVSRQFSSSIERDDLEGELWAFCVEKEADLIRYASDGSLDKVIRTALYRKAYEYATKERDARQGRPDSVHYTPAVVKALLPDCFNPEDWQSSQIEYGKEVRGHEPVNRRGDRLAGILDVRSTFTRIEAGYVNLLRTHYGLGTSVAAMTAALNGELTESAVRKQIDRAVKAICKHLNEPRQFKNPYEATSGQFDSRSKGRRAQSNSSARALSSTYWDE